jgi:hypothetical protein
LDLELLVIFRINGYDDRFIMWVQISWDFDTVLRKLTEQLYHLLSPPARVKLMPFLYTKARPQSMGYEPILAIPRYARVIEIFGYGELIINSAFEVYLFLGKLFIIAF